MDYRLTKQVLEAFEREGVRYVIFGAVALNLHGLARATEDLDVFIAAEEENIERLRRALKCVFDDPHLDEISADDLLGDYPAVQYVPPEGLFHIDILTRLGEVFWVRAEITSHFSHPICTASSARPQSRDPRCSSGYTCGLAQSGKPNLRHIWARDPRTYSCADP